MVRYFVFIARYDYLALFVFVMEYFFVFAESKRKMLINFSRTVI